MKIDNFLINTLVAGCSRIAVVWTSLYFELVVLVLVQKKIQSLGIEPEVGQLQISIDFLAIPLSPNPSYYNPLLQSYVIICNQALKIFTWRSFNWASNPRLGQLQTSIDWWTIQSAILPTQATTIPCINVMESNAIRPFTISQWRSFNWASTWG